MAIDLPPTLPPVQATEVQVKNYASSPASAITANINDIQLKVFGDTYLGNDEIVQLIESSKTPSDAIIRLSNRYYEAGHLLMKIRYYRSLDAIYVYVDQLRLAELRGASQVTDHFTNLVGDSDLTMEEFYIARVIADLQAKRAGYHYSVSYEEQSNNDLVMVFNQKAVENYDATDYILEANNKGNRFLGRYFGLAGINHRFQTGTQLSVAYQTAFADLGESRDGENLDQFSLGIDHPFVSGLYGVELSYVEYERSPSTEQNSSASCLLGALCLLPGTSTSTTSKIDIDAEILQASIHGQQILYSTTRNQFVLKERLQHIDSKVQRTGQNEKLLEEKYQTLEISGEYSRTQYDSQITTASQLNLALSARAGLGGSGTLEDYESFKTRYIAENPNSVVPEVAPAARSADFFTLLPSASYQTRLFSDTSLQLNASGQFTNEQLPQQQQFVLGGMGSLSAYLPGVLVGDEGYLLTAKIERRYKFDQFELTPGIFSEYAGSWYKNTSSAQKNDDSIADAGLSLSLSYGESLYTELVAAVPVYDDVMDEQRLNALEADFYWRIRLTF